VSQVRSATVTGGDFFFFVIVRGRVRGCVEELCWLFFVPCEQSAPMSIMLRIPERQKALDETRQHIASYYQLNPYGAIYGTNFLMSFVIA
jgi:hypothetical protein